MKQESCMVGHVYGGACTECTVGSLLVTRVFILWHWHVVSIRCISTNRLTFAGAHTSDVVAFVS